MIIACWRPSFGQMWTETEDDREAWHVSLVSLMLVTRVPFSPVSTQEKSSELLSSSF